MHKLTVGELIEYLGDMGPETPVRLAFQPNWPLEYSVGRVVMSDGTCWIAEGGQVGYLPGGARQELD